MGETRFMVKDSDRTEVLHLRRERVAAHRTVRRHTDTARDRRGLQRALPVRPDRPERRPRVRGDAPEDRISSSSPSPSETSSSSRTRRRRGQRAAEEKAEGFNPFFLLFHVLDPDDFLNRTVRYIRWIWTPPVVIVWSLAVLWTDRRLHPALGADLHGDVRAVRLPEEAVHRRRPVLLHPLVHRLLPRVRPRLRHEGLRRRRPRHRHRAPLLHARLLLRHDRRPPLREQVATALGQHRR